MNFRSICILGLGYIGLPTAATFAARGLRVHGVDINPDVVASLSRGELHIHEPGLAEIVRQAVESGRLTVSIEPVEADAFLIAVPTPFRSAEQGEYEGRMYKLADMGAVAAAAEAILPVLRKGNLVVLESTSPPRTTVELVAPILERSSLKAGEEFLLCYSPERVLPGQILRELVENDRVVGGINPASAAAGRELYATFVTGEILETDATTAEMVKLMENTARDVNIAIANEFARLADRFGVDVWEAIRLANRHPRVDILSPGPGVGGHCISVDPWFLVEAAPEAASLIHEARRVNDAQPDYVVDIIERTLGSLGGRRIAALGLAYKPDVDDLRESPAVEVVRLLRERGAQVKAWEPHRPDAKLDGIEMAPNLYAAIENVEAIVLLVKHKELGNASPDEIARRTDARILIDCVNAWDPEAWRSAGFHVTRLGVGASE